MVVVPACVVGCEASDDRVQDFRFSGLGFRVWDLGGSAAQTVLVES